MRRNISKPTPLLRLFAARNSVDSKKDLSWNILFQKRERGGKASAGVKLELMGVLTVVNGMMGVRGEGTRALGLKL